MRLEVALFDQLGAVLRAINEQFGTGLDERDRLEAEKLKITLLADEDLKTFANANANAGENSAIEFWPKFKGATLAKEERNRRLYEIVAWQPGASHRAREGTRSRDLRCP